ncbi:peptide chain release factor 3 (bRF-3) [Actinocorallia herbida]|uniref:Peptide chain release factor 3 n=1 Tax=Actinocorallia herbida TaxID=58109 RepID=A0A3N1DBW1_9ACTN|nr:peptide chain release factor 3 [Actinocorallia herbida]ROO91011.1 peptide chain release factor 3 (bRF-3) [Actinocorallia herbida]
MSTVKAKIDEVSAEAARRRTFAVISHPDAGKSTLTEALAVQAAAISTAGAVHGKGDRAGVTSDWMEMERSRGISITSSVLRFDYHGALLNLLDTPGHADFSEDTYRVLSAVDGAVMLLDSAKGLEAQTLKLFDVCKHGNVPILTFVNKWDRPGREPLELLDEVEQRIGLHAAPLNWPVGIAGDFRGLISRADGSFTKFVPGIGGAKAQAVRMSAEDAAAELGDVWETAMEELTLLTEIGAELDEEAFTGGISTPVLFGAALPQFGVSALLDALTTYAPPPAARKDAEGDRRPLDTPFSGQVFKVQAGMDKAHRDSLAFIRVCSGRFERGMTLTMGSTGRGLVTKHAQTVFGRDRTTVDTAYPGDVIGLPNTHGLTVGESLYEGSPAVSYPAIPAFAPEHFMVCRAKDVGKYKQFRRGIEQLDSEGAVQVLRSDIRGDQAPVLAAVGPLQFEVVAHRMEHEFNSPVNLNGLDFSECRLTDAESAEQLAKMRGVEVFKRSLTGDLVVLFADKWRLRAIEREHPDLKIEQMLAAGQY